VAFSVSHDWQGKGLGKHLMAKLADAARENGISGLMAYTSLDNRAMVRLFHTLPYETRTRYEVNMLVLRCRFDHLKASAGALASADVSGADDAKT